MIRQSDAVYPHGNYSPCQGSHEDVYRQPGPDAKHPHPGVDVAAPGNEPKTTVERPQFIELFPQPHMPGIVEQVIEQIAHHQTATYPPPLRIIRTGDKKARYGKIPGMFHEKIEDMLKLSKARGLQLCPRQFAVNAVEHRHSIGERNAKP